MNEHYKMLLEMDEEMRIYKHTGKGHWIGSAVIVQAKDKAHARRMITKELRRMRLEDEELNIELVPKNQNIVHVDDGDY